MKHYIVFVIALLFPFLLFAQFSEDTLTIGYASAPPFVISENGKAGGISVWLWETCAKELQLNYQMVELPFQQMLDDVKNGEIDVSINPLTLTSERLEEMIFTAPFYASHSIVAKGYLSPFERFKNFVRSFFSMTFLSAFLALLTLIGIFGFLVWYFESKVDPVHFRKGWAGIWDGLWWSVVTMTTVGYGDKTPKTKGGKIVALIWMFSGLLFVSGITASVASSLTINQLALETSDLQDFKNRKVGTIDLSSSAQYLENNFFREVQLFSNVSAGLDALVDEEIDAFIYDEPIVRYRLLEDEKYADLIILPSKYKVQFYAYALPQKHSILQERISQKIMETIEGSDWERVLKEYGCGEE